MKLAIVPVLLGALSATAFAAEITKTQAPAPQGYVTIQELPLVLVEGKRWSAADEQAMQNAQNAKLVSKSAERRDVAYVAR
ncbi:MAG: hypothetical protein ABW049_03450 [Spongiibacteraceae bacterium]